MNTQAASAPKRIFKDAGGGFALGAIGGTAYHFLNGLRNSPSGARFIGASEAVSMNAPRIGGSFAIWCGLYTTFDCAFAYTRQKEDPWNRILAGAATSGLLAMREGLLPMGKAALGTGLFFALIEGVNHQLNKALISAQQQQQQQLQQLQLQQLQQLRQQIMIPPVMIGEAPVPPKMEDTPSWFGGLFGKKKEEVKSHVKDTVLESFDSPMPPNFDFQ